MKFDTIRRPRRLTAVLSALLALTVLVGCVGLTGCGEDAPANGGNAAPGGDTVAGETATVTVVNRLNAPIRGAQVYIYTDSTQTDLVTFAQTDEQGKMTFTAAGSAHVAVLKGIAPGYQLADSYPLGKDTVITLDALATPAEGTLAQDVRFRLGDPMMDFTFTDVDGVSHTASEVLKQKRALVLNFWYTTCEPCAMEFPYLQSAYAAYQDTVALLAVSPYESDTPEKIKAFRDSKSLTMPMVDADEVGASRMNLLAYPTTVVIDRYGFIAFSHEGSITEQGLFEKLFAFYGAENYVQVVTSDLAELGEPGTGPTTAPTAPVDGTTAPAGVQGTKDAPIEIGGALQFDAPVRAGTESYYDVYKVDGTVLTLRSSSAYILYDGKRYEPKNGVISFPVTTKDVTVPVRLNICNKGAKDATFRVTFAYPGGTLDNPFSLKMGNLTTDIAAGNESGVVYEYKATATGTVTMSVTSATKGVDYTFSLYNLTTFALRNLEEDGKSGKVSIKVNKGDILQVTVAVLPNDKNEYPAATIKSHLELKSGAAVTQPTQASVRYQVTVKADGKVKSGVKLAFVAGSTKKTLTTDKKGVAALSSKATACTVTLTVPAGYVAEKLRYTLSADSPKLTIQLTKEKNPADEETGETPTEYTVKVVDGAGKAQKNITVQFWNGGKKRGEAKTNTKGVASVTLLDGTYAVKLTGTTLKYDEKAAVVSVAAPSLEILLAKPCGSEKVNIQCPIVGKSRPAYTVGEGATYVTLTPGERNYFRFIPTRSGTFRFSVTSSAVAVGYYGGSVHYIQSGNMAEDMKNNAFTTSIKEVGPELVLGLDAPTNVAATVLRITRVGDAAWSVDDEEWIVYKGTHTPKSYTLPAGTSLTAFDVTKSYKLVYNSADGFYHKGTKNGPLVYLRFSGAPYVSLGDILSSYHVAAYLYDSAGNFIKKEEYSDCLREYTACADKDESVYPLTKDLEYILKQYGQHEGWWDPNHPGYLFDDEDGNPLPDINLDTAWMFTLCYAG